MAGLGIQKAYLGGYYGTNAWNAKTLQVYSELGRNKGNRAIDYNTIDQRNEESRLFDLFMQRFHWEGLPCPEYYLEQSILFNGLAVAYRDEKLGALILPCTIEQRNIYNEPCVVRAIGLGYNQAISVGSDYVNGEGVLMYDNPLFFPPYLQLQRAAQILGDLNRTMEVYGWGLKSPLLLWANDDNVRSIKMTAQGILDNEPYRVLIKETDKKDAKIPLVETGDINSVNLPNTATELRGIMAHTVAYRSDIMSIYGFSGLGGANKLAQTSEGEVSAANSMADANLKIALKLRQRFAKAMNKLFGGDKIKVAINLEDPEETEKGKDEGGVGMKNKKPADAPTSKDAETNIKA